MSDDLVYVAQRGDVDAFACLVERTQAPLRRFCARLAGSTTGTQGLADDLAQETLLRAFRALPRLQDPARFDAWLFAIAANLARKWWRSQARWPLSLDSLLAHYPDVPWTQSSDFAGLRGGAAPPDQVIESAEQTRILQTALDSLPAPLAHVVALHYLDGLNYQEIASALAVPVSTVKGRLFKSRRRLRADLLAAGLSAGAASPAGPTPPNHLTRKGVTLDAPSAVPHAPEPTLEEVEIDSIRANPKLPSRVVILRSRVRERLLCVTIGTAEGDAIAVKLQGKAVPRPLSHDLMQRGFATVGARVTRAVVHDLQGDTFIADIHLDVGGRPVTLDARPSDGFALAVRAGAPIFVATPVMDKAGMDELKEELPPPPPLPFDTV